MCIPLREERLQIKILAYGGSRMPIFWGGFVMALRMRDSFEGLQYQLEQLHNEKYYYVGEYVFAGSHREQNRVRADIFHLWDVPHGDELDRIVMLFADLPVRKSALLIIEGSRVIRTESESSQFLTDAFRTMGQSVPAEAVRDIDYDGITHPVRLIYPKPLFLTFLYRWNLLADGHNLQTLVYTAPEQRMEERGEYRGIMQHIQGELQDYFEPDSDAWLRDFLDRSYGHDLGTRQLCELANYLDGLQVIREALTEEKEGTDNNAPESAERLQRIDDMILTVKHQLRQMEPSARMEVPFPAPEKSAALWRLWEAFPEGMSFGEMVAIRAYLEQALHELKQSEPSHDMPRRHALWEWRLGVLCQQISQMEALLVDEMAENALDWEEYLA